MKLTQLCVTLLGCLMLGRAMVLHPSQAQSQKTLKIVSALPMSGASLGESQTIVNAIQQAIDERRGVVCQGDFKLEYDTYDDATLTSKGWDPNQVMENAEAIVADPEVMAVIGHYNSGATATSLATYNQANLVVVSPTNTYPGLTKPGKGDADEPDKYYPTGRRNYARVVPADDLQGVVAVRWAEALGVKSTYILDDRDTYGVGIANVFESSAKLAGIQVLGRESLDLTDQDYKDLAQRIKSVNPDLIYFGGLAENNAGPLVRDMREVGISQAKFMGADSLAVQIFIEAGLSASEGAYATFGGLPISELTGPAKIWYENYRKQFKSEPQPYAIYGYEAANVILKAIEQVCAADRDKIREAVLATKDYEGVLGKWSFDSNGDTSLTTYSGFQVQNGEWVFIKSLN